MSALGKVAMGFGAYIACGVIGNAATIKQQNNIVSGNATKEDYDTYAKRATVANVVASACLVTGICAAIYEAVVE